MNLVNLDVILRFSRQFAIVNHIALVLSPVGLEICWFRLKNRFLGLFPVCDDDLRGLVLLGRGRGVGAASFASYTGER